MLRLKLRLNRVRLIAAEMPHGHLHRHWASHDRGIAIPQSKVPEHAQRYPRQPSSSFVNLGEQTYGYLTHNHYVFLTLRIS